MTATWFLCQRDTGELTLATVGRGTESNPQPPKSQDGLIPPHLDGIYLYPFYVNRFQNKKILTQFKIQYISVVRKPSMFIT